MVAVVKRLRPWIVIPLCVGSIPTSHPIYAPLVQLDQNATLRTLRSEVRILQGVPIIGDYRQVVRPRIVIPIYVSSILTSHPKP